MVNNSTYIVVYKENVHIFLYNYILYELTYFIRRQQLLESEWNDE